MFKSVITYFILGTIIGCDCLTTSRKNDLYDLFDSYKQINYHLFDHVASDELDVNMREARRWLAEEVSKSSDKNLKVALELFTSMETVGSRCTQESVDILEENDYLTDYGASSWDEDSSTKVIEIIAHYAKEHARECSPTGLKNLLAKYAQAGEFVTRNVHLIVDRVKGVSYDRYGKIVHEALRDLTENDPEAKYLGRVLNRRDGIREINKVKLSELYDKYLVEPCKKFIAMNDDGWYELYKFNTKWIDVRESEDLSRFKERQIVCKHLIGENLTKLYNLFKNEAEYHDS